jgi:hypothetical protein
VAQHVTTGVRSGIYTRTYTRHKLRRITDLRLHRFLYGQKMEKQEFAQMMKAMLAEILTPVVTCCATVDAVQIVNPFIYNLILTIIRSALSHLHSLQSLILL